MIVVLVGPPGAGKGTQADILVSRYHFVKLSTGDALRAEIKENSEVGRKAKALMDAGHLVPDDVLFEIIKANLAKYKSKNILLDGYPRNLNQAETLAKLEDIQKVKAVIHLAVDEKDLVSRLAGRRICESCQSSYHVVNKIPKKPGICDVCQGKIIQRTDDEESKVAVRLKVYAQETNPIVDFYRKKNLCFDVNGGLNPSHVTQDIQKIMDAII